MVESFSLQLASALLINVPVGATLFIQPDIQLLLGISVANIVIRFSLEQLENILL